MEKLHNKTPKKMKKTRDMKTTTTKMDTSTGEEIFAEVERLLKERHITVKSAIGDSSAGIPNHYDDYSDDGEFVDYGDGEIEKLELESLLCDAEMYRSIHYVGPEEERKTCIWPGGKPVSWTELSSGYSWIGVNGTDTTCVVAMSDPVRKRPDGMVQLCCEVVLQGALADMLGDTKCSYHGKIPQSSIAGPLAVVSVAPSLPGQEAQQASRAINFLKEKLKDCSSLSSEETEQIAICALKYLLGRQFKPDKIEIHGWGKYNGDVGRMSEKRVLHAIRQIPTGDLTNSFSTISLSST